MVAEENVTQNNAVVLSRVGYVDHSAMGAYITSVRTMQRSPQKLVGMNG